MIKTTGPEYHSVSLWITHGWRLGNCAIQFKIACISTGLEMLWNKFIGTGHGMGDPRLEAIGLTTKTSRLK